MTRGKKTCKILKEIRQQIAEKNDIEYITSECTFQGECKGTCPKCEAELRYLENELRKRRQLGKVITIAGISLGVAGTSAACDNSAQQSENTEQEQIEQFFDTPKKDTIVNSVDTVKIDTITSKCNVVQKKTKTQISEPILDELILGEVALEGEISARSTSIDPISTPIDQPEIIERFPDIKAEPPGDIVTLLRWLEGNIRYPQGAVVENIGGTVVVEFVVRANGSIDNVTVIKKVHPLLDQEAIRVVKLMKEWKPGRSNGVAVSSYFQLPIQFKLPTSQLEENVQGN